MARGLLSTSEQEPQRRPLSQRSSHQFPRYWKSGIVGQSAVGAEEACQQTRCNQLGLISIQMLTMFNILYNSTVDNFSRTS